MKLFTKLTKVLKISLYIVVSLLIVTFILGKILNSIYLLSFTNFESNQGIWLLFILLIFGVHLPELRVLVKEIIENKVQSYTGMLMYSDMKNRTINDKDYIKELKNKIDEYNPDPVKESGNRKKYYSGSDL
jgi:hypothetical protein